MSDGRDVLVVVEGCGTSSIFAIPSEVGIRDARGAFISAVFDRAKSNKCRTENSLI